MLRTVSILFFVLLFLVVLFVGVEFAAVNLEPVTIDYFLGSSSWPLAGVLVAAFAAGFLATALVSLGIILPLRWRTSRLQRLVSDREQEINALRSRMNQGIR